MRNLNLYVPYGFIGLLLAVPFLLFWRWPIHGEVIFWGTPLFQFWPWHQLVKELVSAGEWPLWNPLLGNGTPLLANLQTALFYPLNLIFFVMPVAHALTLSVVVHLSLAGSLMFGYARQLRLSAFAATVAALTYMFSGFLVGRIQFVPMVQALAWFPLLLLLVERIATSHDKRNILWLGLVLAVQLLAGHAQLWFYGLWLLGPYLIFRIWQQGPGAGKAVRRELLRGSLWLGIAVGLALLLAAAQLLPTVELTGQSPRNSGVEPTFALTYSYWPWRLITLIAPNFFGHPAQGDYWGYANYWEDHAYLGMLPFLLAFSGIWQFFKPWTGSLTSLFPSLAGKFIPAVTRPTNQTSAGQALPVSVVPFFAALVPISLVLALGWNTPIYRWVFDTIPGFSYFQAPSRLLIWYTLAMAILAGVGAQTVTLTAPSARGWRRLLIACAGVTLAGAAGTVVLPGVRSTFLTATSSAGLFLVISIALLLVCPRKTDREEQTIAPGPRSAQREVWWQAAVIAFITVDLLWTAATLIPLIPAQLFEQPIRSAAFLRGQSGAYRYIVDDDFDYAIKFEQFFQFKQFGPPTVKYWQGIKETLAPNLGIFAGLASANNDDPLVVARWQRLIDRLGQADPEQRARLLALMNVAYVIDDPATATWPVIYQDEAIAIQQVPDPLPRAYFVPQATLAPDEATFFTRLAAPDFDSRREAVIMDQQDRLAAEAMPPLDQQDDGSADSAAAPVVSLTTRGGHQIHLSVDAPRAGWVVLTDTFYPGWQATVNGRSAEIWPANLAFRAVAVEAGSQEIVLTYRPLSFTIGLWLSGLTLLATTILLIIWTRNYI